APVLPRLVRLLAERVEGEAHVLYGSTEAEPIAGLPARELERALAGPEAAAGGLCAGHPVPEIAVRLVRPADTPIELGKEGWPGLEVRPGEIGEVVVAGEHVVAGYWNDPQADRRNKIRDGTRVWHRTGDGARFDSEGRLW